MRNPLLTHFINRLTPGGWRILSFAVLFTAFSIGQLAAQANLQKGECECLNNSTTPTNGQYLDYIIFEDAPNQNWILDSPISNFYHPASLPPPAEPILYLQGTKIPEISPGVYKIDAKRVSGKRWTVGIKNNTSGAIFLVEALENCQYPAHSVAVHVQGDDDVCVSSLGKNYVLAPSLPSTYHDVQWTLASGGSIVGSDNGQSVQVDWGIITGSYALKVSGNVRSHAAQITGCNFDLAKVVNVVDPAPYTKIIGDFGNCIGDSELYTIAARPNLVSNVVWGVFDDIAATIPSSGVTITPAGVNTIKIDWPFSPGVYYIKVSGKFRATPTADYCDFENIQRVDIVNEATVPSLACNNFVNLSMSPDCELTFDPSYFLEDAVYPSSSYDIMLRDIEADTIIPLGTIGYGYVGKVIEVKVIHECSGNSCWSFAKIEDKAIPELECVPEVTVNCDDLYDLSVTGFPEMPFGAEVTAVEGSTNSWLIYGYDKCSLVALEYTDEIENTNCSGPYSAIITRKWKAVDNSPYKNVSECVQTIYIERADIDDVIFPNNFDDLTGPNASLEACGDFPKVPYVGCCGDGEIDENNLVPSPEFTGYPIGIQCLNAEVSYEDKKLAVCGDNVEVYKLIRKWTVIDFCADEPDRIREHNQLITVMDKTAPVITCPADITTQVDPNNPQPAAVIPTKPHECVADWDVLPPIAIFDCLPTTWTVDFMLADPITGGMPGPEVPWVTEIDGTKVVGSYPNFSIQGLPKGRTWVRYTVTDLCGNYSHCFTEIDVVDNEEPVAVCDKHSVIALANNGVGQAGVLTFDDGSHDNCELVCMKVRRVDNAIAWNRIECNNRIDFTCNDIGPNKTVQVELGVWDASGLFNSCVVEAKVQDNIPPTIEAPADVTADCTENFTSLTRFGQPTYNDNCTVTITEKRRDDLNDCGKGTITRTFTATDKSGNIAIDSQKISVIISNPFTGNDILWPEDYTTNESCVWDITPANLPEKYAEPRFIRNTSCARAVASYEDLIFNYVEGACQKILRKWTVINCCESEPPVPGVSQWVYTQVIMVNNIVGPTFQKGCDPIDITITQEGECQARVFIQAVAEDDCTPEEELVWSYIIDEYNDGSLEVANGVGRRVDRLFPYGTHKITWTVKDGCGNISTCSNVFTVIDDKKPTPYCITEIGTVIMPTAGEVAIWASDFDRGSTDNCSSGSGLIASFSPTDKDLTSLTVTCDEMDELDIKKFTLDVYFIDEAGNSDFCTVSLFVQDNEGVCKSDVDDDDDETGGRIAISGEIFTEAQETVENVSIQIMSEQPEFPRSVTTHTDGVFEFENLKNNEDYILAPEKEDDILNGVNTLDLVYIQRHILGLQKLNSPYKMIAADINKSTNISVSDLSELRKVILGINNQFANNKSWIFVPKNYIFSNPDYPHDADNVIYLDSPDQDISGNDFIAIKVGDVDESSDVNSHADQKVTTRNKATITQNTVTGKEGDVVEVVLNSEMYNDIVGLQMALAFDNKVATLEEVYSETLNLKDDNINYNDAPNGSIRMSWNSFSAVNTENGLMTLNFRLKKDVESTPLLSLFSSSMKSEIYTEESSEYVTKDVNLDIRRTEGDMDKFEVFQNIPNPFNTSSVIGFNLPQTDEVTLRIYDVTGKMITQTQTVFKKGYNTITIDANRLNSTGVLYYTLETSTHSATRKMIIIK